MTRTRAKQRSGESETANSGHCRSTELHIHIAPRLRLLQISTFKSSTLLRITRSSILLNITTLPRTLHQPPPSPQKKITKPVPPVRSQEIHRFISSHLEWIFVTCREFVHATRITVSHLVLISSGLWP